MSGNRSPCWTTYRPSSPITFCPGASGYSAAAVGSAASAATSPIATERQPDHRRATPQLHRPPCDTAQIIVLPNAYSRQRHLQRARRQDERALRRDLFHQGALIHLTSAGQGLLRGGQGLIGRRLRPRGDGA